MATVFIVRPFGTKTAGVDRDGTEIKVDFDAIDAALIQPALKENGLSGATTGVIAQAGNIRVDMFQMLIAYDLVIADISIDNANVFYELGIRHGLRPGGTILIRFSLPGKEVPFDLRTDRYVSYDRTEPAKAVSQLARAVRETVLAMSGGAGVDSPVFQLLPKLPVPDAKVLVIVPRDFQDSVEEAEKGPAHLGPATLATLAREARNLPWGREGVRLVARALMRIGQFKGARAAWESIRKEQPDDAEANLKLGTVFERMGDIPRSSTALNRVLKSPSVSEGERADARSQLARNLKAAWVRGWVSKGPVEARQRTALGDARLFDAFDGYMRGVYEDLDSYYAGINALGLLTIILELAKAAPKVWCGRFDGPAEAECARLGYEKKQDELRGMVRLALDAAERRARAAGAIKELEEWIAVSRAQFRLLTSSAPEYVEAAYRAVAGSLPPESFERAAEVRQVGIFARLGLFADGCRAAMSALEVEDAAGDDAAAFGWLPAAAIRTLVLVGTGHRVDQPGRPEPRFPNTDHAIARIRAWIQKAVVDQLRTVGLEIRDGAVAAIKAGDGGFQVEAVAGGANGFDLLFHEVCLEWRIPTRVCLPMSREDYRARSVDDGGAEWVQRYNEVCERAPLLELSQSRDLPGWTYGIKDYGIFQRGNIWMLEDALIRPHTDVALIALWNGLAGDGPGGTGDMVALAKERGAICTVETPAKLLQAASGGNSGGGSSGTGATGTAGVAGGSTAPPASE